jgi:hypothetical protein
MKRTGHHGPRYSLFGLMDEEDMLIKAQSLKNVLRHPLSNKAHNMGDPSFMPSGMLNLCIKWKISVLG